MEATRISGIIYDYIRVIHRDNGKQNGSYTSILGLYIGII